MSILCLSGLIVTSSSSIDLLRRFPVTFTCSSQIEYLCDSGMLLSQR